MMRKWVWCVACLLTMPLSALAQEAGRADGASLRRVLLINVMESDLTHSHLGVTAFTNYQNALPNDWNLPGWTGERASSILAEAGWEVVAIQPPDERAKAIRDNRYIKTGWTKSRLEAGFGQWLDGEMKANRASSALILRTVERRFPPDLPVFYSGYGVMSMHGKIPKRAFLFANVAAVPIAADTFEVGRGVRWRDSDCRVRLDPTEIAVDSYENLTATHLAPYREEIQSLMETRLRQDLIAASLLPGEVESCVPEND